MAVALRNLEYMWSTVILPRQGDVYVFGGSLNPNAVQVGTDCSGAVSEVNEALLYGSAMNWLRQFWTGTFAGANPGDTGPFGGVDVTSDWVCIASPNDAPVGAAMIVAVLQLSDPSQAHMVCEVLDPTNVTGFNPTLDPNVYVGIESGGSFVDANGNSTLHIGPEATSVHDPMFNQWFYLPGPVADMTMGLDFSGGRPAPADILAGGYEFVVRYLYDDGGGLKILTKAEADAYEAAGIKVVGVYEDQAQAMQNGAPQGTSDAQDALAHAVAAGMPSGRPIYFAADWDVQQSDLPAVQAYLAACATVLGGTDKVGIYGGLEVVTAALAGGWCEWGWQTEAWSGWPDNGQINPVANIIQNAETIGQVTIDGVQCDVNTAVTADYGQWNGATEMTPEEHQWLAEVWGALFNPITSQSAFRALGEGAEWQQHQMPINDDGMIHPQFVMWQASIGNTAAIARLNEIANASPSQYPDRAADITLAQQVLAALNPPTPTPVTPTPTPTPAVATPGTITINEGNVMQWLKDGVAVLGAIGTWATAVHGVLGQFLNGTSGVVVPGVLALGTAGLTAHTVRQRKSAVKALTEGN